MVGIPLALGVDISTIRALVQGTRTVMRIATDARFSRGHAGVQRVGGTQAAGAL